MTQEETADVDQLERKALDILNALGHNGTTFLVREGAGTGKSVPHLHFHVIPDIAIASVETDARERTIMAPEEVSETIADIKKFL